MNRPALFASICLLLASLASIRAEDPRDIVVARMKNSIVFLADDQQEGRGIGSEGLKRAAEFIAENFRQFGLKTDFYDMQPFQEFEIQERTELGPESENRMAIIIPEKGGKGGRRELKLGEDFGLMGESGSDTLTAPVVFVGYGITAKDEMYDDYANVNVEGKIVLMLRREPQQNNPHSVFNGTENSTYAQFRIKISNAYEHGAAAVIIVNDSFGLRSQAKSARKMLDEAVDQLNQKKAEFAKVESPSSTDLAQYGSEVQELASVISLKSKELEQGFDSLVPFSPAEAGSRKKMPVLFARRSAFESLIQENFNGESLESLEKKIDDELVPQSKELANVTVEIKTTINRVMAPVRNVIGVLEGKGALADETVIVGAHYDHVGRGGAGSGSLAPWTKDIHNGADDNASGTAGLIEVAYRLSKLDSDNRRRIVFIAFTGEERGLLGSAYYVENPLFPLDKTVAMVNMDMIGRLDQNKLIVYGTGTAPGFDELIESLNKDAKFELTKKPTGYGPSDHESFYAAKIPVFHLFTGLHSDYHRPSDDTDKINFDGMARVADLVEKITSHLATTNDRPTYLAVGRERQTGEADASPRAYFGSIPDFSKEVEGYAISGATNGSPAAEAGFKGGDVIIKFGESRIGGLEDFDSALRKYKPGDKVDVVVKRSGEEITLTVKLGKKSQ